MFIKGFSLLKVQGCLFIKQTMSVQVLKEIFLKSVESVRPEKLIADQVKVRDGHLLIRDRSYPLRKPCYIVGFGKAVLGMALELEKLLQDHLKMGVVTVPKGIFENFTVQSKIKFIEGAKDNIPDEDSLKGALEIRDLVQGLDKDDLLLVLISGGGSALLPLPTPPITLREKQDLIKELSIRGADILELNNVRKQISVLKGGGLAELAYPSPVISLVLSDIVGDPLELIASGPTTPSSDQDALAIIKKYNYQLPASIKSALERKKKRFPAITDGKYDHVENIIIGNNRIATEAARRYADSLGLHAIILSTSMTGNVREISRIYANLAAAVCDPSNKQSAPFEQALINLEELNRDVCFIAAGESTVVVTGTGKGGRNQQLALQLSVQLNKLNIKSADISFLSGGTDGIDGPTDAAGAIGTSDLVNNSLEQNIKVEDYLNNNDAYGFYTKFKGGEYLIKIGHTGTNVMDIHVMIIKPKLK